VLAFAFLPGTASTNPGAPNPGHAWTEIENHGTSGSPVNTYWLGTTGNQALELKVNNARALRLEPAPLSPNVIGGYSGNSVTVGVNGATISGGGGNQVGESQTVIGDYGTIGGGGGNTVSGLVATVGGGQDNQAGPGYYATVGGGYGNVASGLAATVGGGWKNPANGMEATVGGGYTNAANADYATVGGGLSNAASGEYATVGGGLTDHANGTSATVGGGDTNTADGIYSTVGGGQGNASGNWGTVGGGMSNIAGGSYATIGGGDTNAASGADATIGGGISNTASGANATIGGGASNFAEHDYATVGGGANNFAEYNYATVGGGQSNEAGQWATVPGGYSNVAPGAYSFAAGDQAQAWNQGAFVWADSTGMAFGSLRNNVFQVRASGGTYIYSNPDASVGVDLFSGSNAWGAMSDRNVKANFASVDGQDILNRLASIPVETWNLKSQDPSIRHMGPMAQDFSAAFGLGEDNLHINTVDADGVALAAIQGLYQLSQGQASRIQALEDENASLKQRLDSLDARVTALEGGPGASAAVSQASASGVPALWPFLGGGLALALVGLVLGRRLVGARR
jgi:hypothetical protein